MYNMNKDLPKILLHHYGTAGGGEQGLEGSNQGDGR